MIAKLRQEQCSKLYALFRKKNPHKYNIFQIQGKTCRYQFAFHFNLMKILYNVMKYWQIFPHLINFPIQYAKYCIPHGRLMQSTFLSITSCCSSLHQNAPKVRKVKRLGYCEEWYTTHQQILYVDLMLLGEIRVVYIHILFIFPTYTLC